MPSLEQICRAATLRGAERFHRTPLHVPTTLSRRLGLGDRVHLKLELLQRTGSFKVRSATARIHAMSEEERALTRLSQLGFVFQFHFLLPEFSIRDNVLLPMQALGRLDEDAQRRRAEDLLSALGLGDHLAKRPDQLSGGQRQRVAVARALANDPPVILADEPTGSLDSRSSEQVFQILSDLVEHRGKTVVAVTHDLDLAGRMGRRIQLVDGRIVADTAVVPA